MGDDSATTRASLLSRLRRNSDDSSAWDEFVARYRPMVLGWCHRWGLQEADAQEVAQAVLLRLAVKMRTFAYDPQRSFRAWLKTLVRRAWCDFISEQSRNAASPALGTTEMLNSLEARIDLEQRLAEAFDLELLELATRRVKERVQTKTWAAFELTAMDGLSGADAALRLGMNVSAVFKAKSNVQKMVRSEIMQLERDIC
jgi:RNA polymerase sigma-70 factor (ECF subfamily)